MIRIVRKKDGSADLYINGKKEPWPEPGKELVISPGTEYNVRLENSK